VALVWRICPVFTLKNKTDEELKIVTAEELAEMEKSAMEFDGFLGFTVRGRLVR
jgi:hypothetical protein